MPASCKRAGSGAGAGRPALRCPRRCPWRCSCPWARRCLRFMKFESGALSWLGRTQGIQLVGQGVTLLKAGARGDGAAMENRAARDDQAAGTRRDDDLGLFFIIVIDGLAAPVGLPFQVRVIERRDVPFVRRAVAMQFRSSMSWCPPCAPALLIAIQCAAHLKGRAALAPWCHLRSPECAIAIASCGALRPHVPLTLAQRLVLLRRRRLGERHVSGFRQGRRRVASSRGLLEPQLTYFSHIVPNMCPAPCAWAILPSIVPRLGCKVKQGAARVFNAESATVSQRDTRYTSQRSQRTRRGKKSDAASLG